MIIEIDTDFAQEDPDPTTEKRIDQLTQLEGIEYLHRFIWLPRPAAWYLSLLDQDENPIAVGRRLNIGVSLFRHFIDPRLPPGVLAVGDLSQQGQEIVLPTDLGTRVPLFYWTSDELP